MMMRKRKQSVMLVAAAVVIGTGGVAGVGYAQDREAERSDQRERAASQTEQRERSASMTEHRTVDAEGRLLEASDVVEYEVVNQQGEAIGTISDLAIDTRRGQIAYAILKLEEPLALEGTRRTSEAQQARQGEAQQARRQDEARPARQEQEAGRAQREVNQFAVPWAAFRLASGEEALELTINRGRLAQGRGFDDQWEQLSDRQWATRQHQSLGFDPYWESERNGDNEARESGIESAREGGRESDRESARAERSQQDRATEDAASDGDMHAAGSDELHVEALSELIGREIHNPQDEALAKIDDFMVDTRQGHIAYAILNYGGFLGMGSSYVAVPYQALELDLEEERFVLDANEDTLDQHAYSRRERPEMTDGPWAQEVHEAFSQEPYWQVFGYGPPSKAYGEAKEEAKPSTESGSDQK